MRIGVLHTVPALVDPFRSLIAAAVPSSEQAHVADASLLADARAHGMSSDLESRVVRHVDALLSDGAEIVLVTCSSIGEAVDVAAAQGRPVMRVDEAMARESVRLAREGEGRIATLATLDATIRPTESLIRRIAGETALELSTTVVPGAIEARESGDQAAHDRLVREAVAKASRSTDVIVLAQASMAAALAGLEFPIPVLTSPELGVAALAAAVSGR